MPRRRYAMNKFTVAFIFCLFLPLVLALPAYGQESLSGVWVCEEEWDGVLVRDFFTFNSDGTGEWKLEDGKDFDTFTYVTEENTITMKWKSSGETTVYNFTFNGGGTLTLGIDFGFGEGYQKFTYKKVKK